MTRCGAPNVEQRVVRAAEAALADHDYVSSIDVLIGLGWLDASAVDRWRQGRIDYLEQVTQANLSKVSRAMKAFRRWARERGLRPSETGYVARTRDRRRLRFSASGDEEIERAYRTHWVSPVLSERKREQLAERQSRPPDLVVISPVKDWTCANCGGTGDLLIMDDAGPTCLACAELDHLVFLGSGDATLTRRAKKASELSAVVVRFSRARKRYERQGILVEEAALAAAESQCLSDEAVRARRRTRDQPRRAAADEALTSRIVEEIGRLYPGCPAPRARAIAEHAAVRGSGRVGRTAAAKAGDVEAITLAVVASVRHEETPYDELLMAGVERSDARVRVRDQVDEVLRAWRSPQA